MGRHEGKVSRRTWGILTAIASVFVAVLAVFGLVSLMAGGNTQSAPAQAAPASSPVPTSEVPHEHNISASMAVPAGQMAMDAGNRVAADRAAVNNDQNARAEQARLDQAGPVLFPADTAMLTPEGEATVGRIVDLMRADPDLRVEVVGNTAVEINDQPLCLQLSQLRAEQVATRMEAAGISPARVSAIGISHTQPKDTATDSRRAEFLVKLH